MRLRVTPAAHSGRPVMGAPTYGLRRVFFIAGGNRRGRHNVKNNIVYILCKDILYTLCKHIVYKFLLIEALIFLLNEDRCESDKPVSSGILAYLRQSSR